MEEKIQSIIARGYENARQLEEQKIKLLQKIKDKQDFSKNKELEKIIEAEKALVTRANYFIQKIIEKHKDNLSSDFLSELKIIEKEIDNKTQELIEEELHLRGNNIEFIANNTLNSIKKVDKLNKEKNKNYAFLKSIRPLMAKSMAVLFLSLSCLLINVEANTLSENTHPLKSVYSSSQTSIRLSSDEFFVPQKVMYAFGQTMDTKMQESQTPGGTYLKKNYLDSFDKIEMFKLRLIKLGFSQYQINDYIHLFSQSNIIIFNEAETKNQDKFKELRVHERMHKYFYKLNSAGQNYMKKVAKAITGRMENEENFGKERRDKNGLKIYSGFHFIQAIFNWQEFYNYLYAGDFTDNALKTLKRDYPIAYKIYQNVIREATRGT